MQRSCSGMIHLMSQCAYNGKCLISNDTIPQSTCLCDHPNAEYPMVGNPYIGCTWDMSGRWEFEDFNIFGEAAYIYLEETDETIETSYIRGLRFINIGGPLIQWIHSVIVDFDDPSSILIVENEGYLDKSRRKLATVIEGGFAVADKVLNMVPDKQKDLDSLTGLWRNEKNASLSITRKRDMGGDGISLKSKLNSHFHTYWLDDKTDWLDVIKLSRSLFVDKEQNSGLGWRLRKNREDKKNQFDEAKGGADDDFMFFTIGINGFRIPDSNMIASNGMIGQTIYIYSPADSLLLGTLKFPKQEKIKKRINEDIDINDSNAYSERIYDEELKMHINVNKTMGAGLQPITTPYISMVINNAPVFGARRRLHPGYEIAKHTLSFKPPTNRDIQNLYRLLRTHSTILDINETVKLIFGVLKNVEHDMDMISDENHLLFSPQSRRLEEVEDIYIDNYTLPNKELFQRDLANMDILKSINLTNIYGQFSNRPRKQLDMLARRSTLSTLRARYLINITHPVQYYISAKIGATHTN